MVGEDEFSGFDVDAFVQSRVKQPPQYSSTLTLAASSAGSSSYINRGTGVNSPHQSPFTLPSTLPLPSPPKSTPSSSFSPAVASASSSVASTLASANPWARTINHTGSSGSIHATQKQFHSLPSSTAASSVSLRLQPTTPNAASATATATAPASNHVSQFNPPPTAKPSTNNWIALSNSTSIVGSGSSLNNSSTSSNSSHSSTSSIGPPSRSSHSNTADPSANSTSAFMPPTHSFAAPSLSSSTSLTFASPAPARPSLTSAAAAAASHSFAQSMQKTAPTVFTAATSSPATSSSSFHANTGGRMNPYQTGKPTVSSAPAPSNSSLPSSTSSPSPFSATSASTPDSTTRVRVVSSNVPSFQQNRSLPGQGIHHGRINTAALPPSSPQRPSETQIMPDDKIQSACSAYMSMDSIRRANELDASAISSYIFPREKSGRKYQRDIVWTCLRYNTLVCLPTGTGKTLIAAVALFNFYRWYPHSQVLFVAPTRPLVMQQLRACQQIMDIPDQHCALIIGQAHSEEQKRDIYSSDVTRVLFATPQAIMSDVDKGLCRINRFVFLCIDECHKAQKNYSYTELADRIHHSGHDCRIVGLSATPGTDTHQVADLVKKIRFARLEIRDESDTDLAAHLHVRDVQMYVVKASDVIPQIEEAIFDCIRPRFIYLAKAQIMFSYDNPKQLSSQKMNTIRGSFMKQNDSKTKERYWEIFNQLTLCYNLYRIRDRLREAGVGQCFEAMREFIIGDASGLIKKKTGEAKPADPVTAAFRNDAHFKKLRSMVEGNVQSMHSVLDEDTPLKGNSSGRAASPSNVVAASSLSDREHTQKLAALRTHNPKIAALVQLVSTHFKQHEQREEWMRTDQPDEEEAEEEDSMYEESKRGDAKIYFNGKSSESNVIIFADRRGVVQELVSRLNQFGPAIRAAPFIGQAKDGMNQKEQAACLEKFSDGTYNVIVATCIAEEGLDMGHVDLIISFDITGSPLRIIQRFGRTGRKRRGRCITMVEEGREVEEYTKAMQAKDRLLHQLKSYGRNPPFAVNKEMKMMPPQVLPVEVLMDVAHQRERSSTSSNKRRSRNSLLSSTSIDPSNSWNLPPIEFARMQTTWNLHPPSQFRDATNDAMPSPVHQILHSKRTLKQCDLAMRFEQLQRKFDRTESQLESGDEPPNSKRYKTSDNGDSIADGGSPTVSLFDETLWEEQRKQAIENYAKAAEQVRLSMQQRMEKEKAAASRKPLSKELSTCLPLSSDKSAASAGRNGADIRDMIANQQQQQSSQKQIMGSTRSTVRALQYPDSELFPLPFHARLSIESDDEQRQMIERRGEHYQHTTTMRDLVNLCEAFMAKSQMEHASSPAATTAMVVDQHPPASLEDVEMKQQDDTAANGGQVPSSSDAVSSGERPAAAASSSLQLLPAVPLPMPFDTTDSQLVDDAMDDIDVDALVHGMQSKYDRQQPENAAVPPAILAATSAATSSTVCGACKRSIPSSSITRCCICKQSFGCKTCTSSTMCEDCSACVSSQADSSMQVSSAANGNAALSQRAPLKPVQVIAPDTDLSSSLPPAVVSNSAHLPLLSVNFVTTSVPVSEPPPPTTALLTTTQLLLPVPPPPLPLPLPLEDDMEFPINPTQSPPWQSTFPSSSLLPIDPSKPPVVAPAKSVNVPMAAISHPVVQDFSTAREVFHRSPTATRVNNLATARVQVSATTPIPTSSSVRGFPATVSSTPSRPPNIATIDSDDDDDDENQPITVFSNVRMAAMANGSASKVRSLPIAQGSSFQLKPHVPFQSQTQTLTTPSRGRSSIGTAAAPVVDLTGDDDEDRSVASFKVPAVIQPSTSIGIGTSAVFAAPLIPTTQIPQTNNLWRG